MLRQNCQHEFHGFYSDKMKIKKLKIQFSPLSMQETSHKKIFQLSKNYFGFAERNKKPFDEHFFVFFNNFFLNKKVQLIQENPSFILCFLNSLCRRNNN